MNPKKLFRAKLAKKCPSLVQISISFMNLNFIATFAPLRERI